MLNRLKTHLNTYERVYHLVLDLVLILNALLIVLTPGKPMNRWWYVFDGAALVIAFRSILHWWFTLTTFETTKDGGTIMRRFLIWPWSKYGPQGCEDSTHACHPATDPA